MGIDTEFNQCQIAGAGQKSMLLCTMVFVVAFTELNVTCRYLRMKSGSMFMKLIKRIFIMWADVPARPCGASKDSSSEAHSAIVELTPSSRGQ
jgi:hypothetical protein